MSSQHKVETRTVHFTWPLNRCLVLIERTNSTAITRIGGRPFEFWRGGGGWGWVLVIPRNTRKYMPPPPPKKTSFTKKNIFFMVNNAACSVIKNTIPRGLGKKFLHKRNHPFLPPPPQKRNTMRHCFYPINPIARAKIGGVANKAWQMARLIPGAVSPL